MLTAIKRLLGIGPPTNYKQLLNEGGIILDVRTKGEFAGGHIKGSLNIPVDQLNSQLAKLKNKNQPIITCCASGMRSASAKGILAANGYSQVFNGGGWHSLQSKLT